MWKFLTGGITQSIENIASEWIETNQEKAEAQAVMVKALDPNGKMRRDMSKTVCFLYVVYIAITGILILLQAFDISTIVTINGETFRSVDLAVGNLKELFLPITQIFMAIVLATFGVNGINSAKGK